MDSDGKKGKNTLNPSYHGIIIFIILFLFLFLFLFVVVIVVVSIILVVRDLLMEGLLEVVHDDQASEREICSEEMSGKLMNRRIAR
jgi:hypothetical protein